MANMIGEYVSGCSDFSLAVMRSILLVLCAFEILGDIVMILFIQDSVAGIMINLVDCLIVSFGAIGAYKKNYKFLMLFAGAYLIFGTVLLFLTDGAKSTDDLINEQTRKMLKYAKEYDFESPAISIIKKEANNEWDQYQSRGCCGADGPGDWLRWGRPGPPKSCCRSERDVDLNNVCTKPYKLGCEVIYSKVAEIMPAVRRSVSVIALIFGFMALFMAYNYHSKELRNDAHAGRQSGVNHPASIIDVYVGDQATSGQVHVRQMDDGQRQHHMGQMHHMPPPAYEHGQMRWPVDGKQSLSSHQNASKIDTKSKF